MRRGEDDGKLWSAKKKLFIWLSPGMKFILRGDAVWDRGPQPQDVMPDDLRRS